jgi:hypothetical protein
MQASRSGKNVSTALTDLRTALSVAQSADRTPPAVAWALYQEALRELGK